MIRIAAGMRTFDYYDVKDVFIRHGYGGGYNHINNRIFERLLDSLMTQLGYHCVSVLELSPPIYNYELN